MDRRAEWQFHLWPLEVGIGVRSSVLTGLVPDPADPAAVPAAVTKPLSTPRSSAPEVPELEERILIWEEEGGNLGSIEPPAEDA